MALFGFGKDKRDSGSSELVLAYLEEAARLRSPLLLVDPRRHEIPASIQSIHEEGGLLVLQLSGTMVADKGARLGIVLIHDGLRLVADTCLQAVKSSVVELELPSRLEIQERRRHPRARLNPREGATLTGLTGLFDGVGITGVLENLSEGGVRVKVEKAMGIQGEKKLHVSPGLLKAGTTLPILKLNKIPKAPPVLELSGKVVYEDISSGLSLGIAFTGLPAELSAAVRNVVSARVQPAPTSLPPKVRRSQELSDPETLLPPERPAPSVRAASPPPVEAVPKADPPPPRAPALPEETAGSTLRTSPLLRLKKRSRTLLVVSADGLVREMLQMHLLEEGYGRVLTAGTLTELLEQLQEPGIGLILLDDGVAELQGLDLVAALGRMREDLPPIVLAAEEVSTIMVLEARRVGVAQLLVKPYLLDDAFSELLETQMGLS